MPAVGIDLGTTNSVAAFVDPTGRPESIVNFEGDILTPSMVLVEGDAVTVGREAGKAAALYPEQFAECFKRWMGDPEYPRLIDGRTWRPEVLSAFVLRRLRNDVVRRLGAADAAVITVPAYFDEARRRATWSAAQVAGWQPIDLINEPTAAAITYAHGNAGAADGRLTRVLVFDLGGGTFDTTVLEARAGVEYRTVATEGEVRLGGQDWDERLAGHLADQFRTRTGCDPMATEPGRLEFTHIARSVKHTLSVRPKATVPCAFGGHRTILEASRAGFEQLTSDLLQRARTTTELVLEQAELTWAEIDRVLLIGGSTRMPMVARMFQELTGRPPDGGLSPDEAVAHGAATYAWLLDRPRAPRVVNVSSHTYRVHAFDKQRRRLAVPVIAHNSPLPAENTRSFAVEQAGQAVVTVCEGESDDPAACPELGEVRVVVPPSPVGRRRIVAVTLTCRTDGSLSVTARVREDGERPEEARAAQAELVPRQGLSDAQVREFRSQLDAFELT